MRKRASARHAARRPGNDRAGAATGPAPRPVGSLLLAAHGSVEGPDRNAPLLRLARVLGRRAGVPVEVGFHRGHPSFAIALERLPLPVTVVPLMTSGGWYSQVVLPRALRGSPVRFTAPLGTWDAIPDLVAGRIRRRRLPVADTGVLVVGHGTPRHPRSREATERLAAALEAMGLASRVEFALLDEDPRPAEALSRLDVPHVVVVPFLIGEGLHALRDLPARPGLRVEPPLGSLPGLADLILRELAP